MIGFPKPEPRIVTKQRKNRDDKAAEREARIAVKRRDHGKCTVPGCKSASEHLHHIVYRSRSKARRWDVENLTSLCASHHSLVHAGKITITRNEDGELIVTGEKKYLEFRL